LTTRDYDIEKNLIIVSHCTYDSKEPDGPPIYKLSKEKLIIDLNKSAKDLRRYFNTNYSLEADAAAFKKLSKTLIKIETKLNYVSSKWTELNPDRLGHTIDTFLSALDTKECKTYNKVDDSIHCKIEKAQAMLLSILSHIIEGKGKITQNKYFLELLYNYNSFNSEIHFHEDGAIAFETTLPSEDFFIIKEVIPHDILKVNKNDVPVMVAITFFLFKFLQLPNCVKLINECNECGAVYISKTVRNSKYCSDKCRMGFHNKRRIESGEHAAYKRQRKESGKATPSYWGPSPNKG
jgi:hypothetical protein